MGVKTVTFYPGNADLGLHTHMAVVELLSRATGEPLAVMDGRLITEMRTAAVSAVALAALLPPGASQPGHPWQRRAGARAPSGVQAGLARSRRRSASGAARRRNAERLAQETGARAVAIEEAAAADVVLTVTSSPTPVLEGRWLSPQALVLAVGASGATLRELDDEAMLSSCVVAESRSCVERESGDVRFSGAKVQAEIGRDLWPTPALPVPRDGRIVFKSVGMAIEDLTAARLVWQAHSRAEIAFPNVSGDSNPASEWEPIRVYTGKAGNALGNENPRLYSMRRCERNRRGPSLQGAGMKIGKWARLTLAAAALAMGGCGNFWQDPDTTNSTCTTIAPPRPAATSTS